MLLIPKTFQRHGLRLNLHVYSIQKWFGQTIKVPAIECSTAPSTAGWIGRAHQQKSSREAHRASDTCNRHRMLLKRLAKRIQYASIELGQFIKKEHPVVGKTCFTRMWTGPPTDDRRAGRRMVWRANRTRPGAQSIRLK